MIQDRTCHECKRTFPGGPRAYYCPGCRAERKRQQTADFKCRKRVGETRPLGSTDTCERCGAEYEVVGGLQRFCLNCRPIHTQEYDRDTSITFYRANSERINPPRKLKRRKRGNVCAICGVEFEPVNGSTTCSEACKREQSNQNNRDWYRREKERNTPPEEVLDLTQIAAQLGRHKSTLSNWYRAGQLPPPDIYTASGRPRWLKSTVEPLIKNQME